MKITFVQVPTCLVLQRGKWYRSTAFAQCAQSGAPRKAVDSVYNLALGYLMYEPTQIRKAISIFKSSTMFPGNKGQRVRKFKDTEL